jgi:hypothetical protein
MRVKESYYACLEELHRVFGEDATMLTIDAAAKYLHKNYRTLLADKTFPAKKIGGRYEIYIVNFARWLST